MKELSDKKFDELLKQKAESADFFFDESAWDKMEQKLRRRDRVLFIRNSSFVLMLLFLFGGAYWLLNGDSISESNNQNAQKFEPLKPGNETILPGDKNKSPIKTKEGEKAITEAPLGSEKRLATKPASTKKTNQKSLLTRENAIDKPSSLSMSDSSEFIPYVQLDRLNASDNKSLAPDEELIIVSALFKNDTIKSKPEIKNSPKNRKLSFSVTALAGPDFSSVESITGKKGNLNIGLLLNTTISKKITLSSGVKYGLKSYAASAYDYKLKNPSRADKISGIDASCNILEIPLQISYLLFQNNKNKVQVSSGLSSYLMLKEEYNFKYTPQSGYKDYLLVKNNANQHYLSVLNLAASYHIKPKSSNIQWAIEPYVKLPLGGVGEGNVRLKSSGISLNMTYDITKKNK